MHLLSIASDVWKTLSRLRNTTVTVSVSPPAFLIPTFTRWEGVIPLSVFPTYQHGAAIQVLPRGRAAESEEAVGKNGLLVFRQPFDDHVPVCRRELAFESWRNTRGSDGMRLLSTGPKNECSSSKTDVRTLARDWSICPANRSWCRLCSPYNSCKKSRLEQHSLQKWRLQVCGWTSFLWCF